MAEFKSISEAVGLYYSNAATPAVIGPTEPNQVSDASCSIPDWESWAPVQAHGGMEAHFLNGMMLSPNTRRPLGKTVSEAAFAGALARIEAVRSRIPEPVSEKGDKIRTTQGGLIWNGGGKGVHDEQSAYIKKVLGDAKTKYDDEREKFEFEQARKAYDDALAAYNASGGVTSMRPTGGAYADYEAAKVAYASRPTRDRAVDLFRRYTSLREAVEQVRARESTYVHLAARAPYYQSKSFRSFIQQEGNIDSLNTWDMNAFSWGVGFANIGGIPWTFLDIYANYLHKPTAEIKSVVYSSLELQTAASLIDKLFHIAGVCILPYSTPRGGASYVLFDGEELSIPLEKKKKDDPAEEKLSPGVRHFVAGDRTGLRAFQGGTMCTRTRVVLYLLAWICSDPQTQKVVVEAQMRILFGYTNGGVLARRLDSQSAYSFVTKVTHALSPMPGGLGEVVWRKLNGDVAKKERERERIHVQYAMWDAYLRDLRAVRETADPPLAAAEVKRVDEHVIESSVSGRPKYPYLRRNLEIEPPTRMRDREIAMLIMQYVCHSYELNRLMTAVQKIGLRPIFPVEIDKPNSVYSFGDRWFYQAGVRHWMEALGDAKRKNDPDYLFLGSYKDAVAEDLGDSEEARRHFAEERYDQGSEGLAWSARLLEDRKRRGLPELWEQREALASRERFILTELEQSRLESERLLRQWLNTPNEFPAMINPDTPFTSMREKELLGDLVKLKAEQAALEVRIALAGEADYFRLREEYLADRRQAVQRVIGDNPDKRGGRGAPGHSFYFAPYAEVSIYQKKSDSEVSRIPIGLVAEVWPWWPQDAKSIQIILYNRALGTHAYEYTSESFPNVFDAPQVNYMKIQTPGFSDPRMTAGTLVSLVDGEEPPVPFSESDDAPIPYGWRL